MTEYDKDFKVFVSSLINRQSINYVRYMEYKGGESSRFSTNLHVGGASKSIEILHGEVGILGIYNYVSSNGFQ